MTRLLKTIGAFTIGFWSGCAFAGVAIGVMA